MSRTMSVLYKHNPFFLGARTHYPPGDVNHYADQSGGSVLKSSKEAIAGNLARLIDELRSRYTIGFKPTEQAEGTARVHRIEVRASGKTEKRLGHLLIKTRSGYYR